MDSSEPIYVTRKLWVEEGEPRFGWVADVALVIPVAQTYSFAVPHDFENSVRLGQRVFVPFGRKGRQVEGYVVGLEQKDWESTLGPIGSVVDDEPLLTPELVSLGREIAEHYSCGLGLVLNAMTAEAVRLQRGMKTIRHVSIKRPPHGAGADSHVRERAVPRGPKRRAVLDVLASAGKPLRMEEVLARASATAAVLRALVADGWIEITKSKEAPLAEPSAGALREPNFELNVEQRAAVETIAQDIQVARFSVSLLFGVSGSGKTEVYIHAIREVLARGRQAILLVPEILLTTQLVERLSSRLADVAVSHSGLTAVQRSLIWRQMAAGEKRVALGTRSAVFAPFTNLGLIVVDEEQEGSFKNLRAPRFHVRDVAIMRAKALGIPVLLGSATPSLETWHRSGTRSDYQRLILLKRVKDLPLPRIEIVDMRDEYLEKRQGVVLSRQMLHGLGESLARDEQAVILMNRRGFAQRVFCPACNTRLVCPNCSVGLVMHTKGGESICHYCRLRIPTPEFCPTVTCGERLLRFGVGTQQVEEILREYFPKKGIERVDRDTMRHRRDYERIVSRFGAREIDVLVGTQMIAKGLDFPLVSFVGVVSGDATSFSADFRAHERLFQLITQVAGRAGRAEASGSVVVQSMTPALPALQFALRHDYAGFAEEELPLRQHVGLPPFRRLARILVTHVREETARTACEQLVLRIREAIAELKFSLSDVLGPNACLISRLRKQYRFDLLVRTPDAISLRRLFAFLRLSGKLRVPKAAIVVDVDPVSLA